MIALGTVDQGLNHTFETYKHAIASLPTKYNVRVVSYTCTTRYNSICHQQILLYQVDECALSFDAKRETRRVLPLAVELPIPDTPWLLRWRE